MDDGFKIDESALRKNRVSVAAKVTSQEFEINENNRKNFFLLLKNINKANEGNQTQVFYDNLKKMNEILFYSPKQFKDIIEESNITEILYSYINNSVPELANVCYISLSNLLQLDSPKIKQYCIKNDIFGILNSMFQNEFKSNKFSNVNHGIKILINLFDYVNHENQFMSSKEFVEMFLSSVDFNLLYDISFFNVKYAESFADLINHISSFINEKKLVEYFKFIDIFLNYFHNFFEEFKEDIKLVSSYLNFMAIIIHTNFLYLTQINDDILCILDNYNCDNLTMFLNILLFFYYLAKFDTKKDDINQKIKKKVLYELKPFEIKEGILKSEYCIKPGFMLLYQMIIMDPEILKDQEFKCITGYSFVLYNTIPYTYKSFIAEYIICILEHADLSFLDDFVSEICNFCKILLEDQSNYLNSFLLSFNSYITRLICSEDTYFFKFIKVFNDNQLEQTLEEYDTNNENNNNSIIKIMLKNIHKMI